MHRLGILAGLALAISGCIIEPNPSPGRGGGGGGNAGEQGAPDPVGMGATDAGAASEEVAVYPDAAGPAADTPSAPDAGPLLLCEEYVSAIDADPADYEWGCEPESPCGKVWLVTDGGETGSDQVDYFDDPDAIVCALQKLRDRAPVRLDIQRGDLTGQYSWNETIFIVDADHAVAHGSSFADVPVELWLKRRQILQPPEYFDSCLLLLDEAEIFDCLESWTAGCSDTPVPCPQ